MVVVVDVVVVVVVVVSFFVLQKHILVLQQQHQQQQQTNKQTNKQTRDNRWRYFFHEQRFERSCPRTVVRGGDRVITMKSCDGEKDAIRLVVWDFDMTILRIHSFAKRISALDIPRRDYERDCADANFFRAFLREMKQKSIEVAIASFGKRDVIETYIKHLVDAEKGDDVADYAFVDTQKSIVTPNDVGGTDGCSMKDKSRMLDMLTKRYVLSMSEDDILKEGNGVNVDVLLEKARKKVVFFDDDEDNINAAKKLGYTYAVHTPNAFERESWRELYWKIPKLRELFPEVDVHLTHSKTRKVQL